MNSSSGPAETSAALARLGEVSESIRAYLGGLGQTLRWLISSTLILRLNFYTLAVLAITLAVVAYTTVRSRYLRNYAKLSAEPLRRETHADLFPETLSIDSKPALHNYLDEFLSAIKVFGYLERPVFHELTRHMHTKKILAGETLNLEDEQSFCLVIDGHVQVFSRKERGPDTGADDDEDRAEGYRLLTDVRNGAPLSSMFTILSLFTEDVQLRARAEDTEAVPGTPDRFLREPSVRLGSPAPESPRLHIADRQGLVDRPHLRSRQSGSGLRDVPHIPLLDPPTFKRQTSVHPGIIARATIDTTIAVIPAEAFRRLTKVYPKAAAHIVQVIMTRYQRVTFATGHNYLGLTAEILTTEKNMNDLTTYELPNYVRASTMEKVKQKVRTAALSGQSGVKPEAVIVSAPGKVKPHREAKPHGQKARRKSRPLSVLREVELPISEQTSPVPSVYEGKGPASEQNFSMEQEMSDDRAFRDSVLRCIFDALGLDGPAGRSGPASVEQSPRVTAQDTHRPPRSNFGAAINNMMLDLNGLGSEIESESGWTTNSIDGVEVDLDSDLQIVYYPRDSILVETQESSPGLFYVIDGFLEVGIVQPATPASKVVFGHNLPKSDLAGQESQNPFEAEFGVEDADNFDSLYTVKPGGIAGYQAGLGNHRSFVDIRAKTDTLVGFLPRASLERIMEKRPIVLLTMAKRIISLLSPLVLHLDFALGWVQVAAGETIYRQGEDADAIYIVLNGRVRGIRQRSRDEQDLVIAGEHGNGESVGELEVLTDSPRPFTLHAVRETELARFPKELFQSLAMEYPRITMQISKLIARRMGDLLDDRERSIGDEGSGQVPKSVTNLRTIAILPISQQVPLTDFASRLSVALSTVGSSVAILDQPSILAHLGRHAFSRIGKLRLAGHLADLEEHYSKILYVADAQASSPWTQTCVNQADCILYIGLASADPNVSEFERLVASMRTTARKELVLLHADRSVPRGLTRQWLVNRQTLHAHHHVEMDTLSPHPSTRPQAALRTLTTIKRKIKTVQDEISRYAGPLSAAKNKADRQDLPPENFGLYKNDYARLARRLCGQSIGLVLGGGGARGLSHIGVVKALEEAGIPIDIVGGTSIGAFIGGLYALDGDVVPMYGRAKRFSGRMAGLWRFVLDLTYPAVSYTTGHEFNRGIWKAFGQSQIEDFWLPYFTNTTNITHSRMDIHTSGYAWRYVRASMSLAGLVPPMTDNGDMLCDGGYVDNLPVSKMRGMGAKYIFAVDVGSVSEHIHMSYGDTLSGVWATFNRWNPFSSHPDVPNLTDIQSRLAYSASVPALEKAKKMRNCIYMRPPIADYGTLEFGKFDEIYEVGYKFAKDFLKQAIAEGKLKELPVVLKGAGRRKPNRRNSRPANDPSQHYRERRNSL